MYTFSRPRRANPHSVSPRSPASSIASELGAPTPIRIGAPAHRRLLHELERQPSAHAQDVVGERQQAVDERPADHLVHRVVAADVLTRMHELAGGV